MHTAAPTPHGPHSRAAAAAAGAPAHPGPHPGPGRTAARALCGIGWVLALAGCQTLGPTARVDVQEPTTVRPQVQTFTHTPNGAIFQASSYRPLFEDHRARLVGDSLTVQISEKTSAVQKSSSNVERTGSLSGSVTALPGRASTLPRLGVAGSSSNVFAGQGDSASSNDFSGTVTATVVEVLPNGHMIIAGEKQLGVNETVEVLRFSGRIDPRAIGSGNVVTSTQIADARIEFRGRGQTAEAQGMGWLSRFFLSLMPI